MEANAAWKDPASASRWLRRMRLLAGCALGLTAPLRTAAAGEPSPEEAKSAETAAVVPEASNMSDYYQEWRSRLEEIRDGIAHGEAVIGAGTEEYFAYRRCEEQPPHCEHRLKSTLVPLEKALDIVAKKAFPQNGLVTVLKFDVAGSEQDRLDAAVLAAKIKDQADTGNYYIEHAAAQAADIQKRYARIRNYHPLVNFKTEECAELLSRLAGLRENYLVKLTNALSRHKQYWDQLERYQKQ